jgi:hypothetical protein
MTIDEQLGAAFTEVIKKASQAAMGNFIELIDEFKSAIAKANEQFAVNKSNADLIHEIAERDKIIQQLREELNNAYVLGGLKAKTEQTQTQVNETKKRGRPTKNPKLAAMKIPDQPHLINKDGVFCCDLDSQQCVEDTDCFDCATFKKNAFPEKISAAPIIQNSPGEKIAAKFNDALEPILAPHKTFTDSTQTTLKCDCCYASIQLKSNWKTYNDGSYCERCVKNRLPDIIKIEARRLLQKNFDGLQINKKLLEIFGQSLRQSEIDELKKLGAPQ